MLQPDVSLHYDPNRLLDTLAQWLGTGSDRLLSKVLQLSPQVIRSMRSGHLPIHASLLLSMAECAGTGIEELRRVLGDRRRKARMSCSLRTI